MQALRLYGPSDLRLEEVPIPKAPAGGLVVEVKACISAAVTSQRAGRRIFPGWICPSPWATNSGVSEVGKRRQVCSGQKGCPGHHHPLRRCRYCLRMHNHCDRKGPLPVRRLQVCAVLQHWPRRILFMPRVTSEASCGTLLLCPQRPNFPRWGWGCGRCHGCSPIALCTASWPRPGASKVILTEVVADRLELSKDFPEIDVRIDSTKEDPVERVLAETQGAGADVIMVAAPSGEAQAQATKMAAKRGRVNLFGGLPKGKSETTFDSNVIHYRELFVHGTSDSTVPQMMAILDLMASRRVDPSKLVSKVFPLSQFKEAFELAGSGKALKVILEPGK